MSKYTQPYVAQWWRSATDYGYIENLSYDAAVEVARAWSSVPGTTGRIMPYLAIHEDHVEVFENGQLKRAGRYAEVTLVSI